MSEAVVGVRCPNSGIRSGEKIKWADGNRTLWFFNLVSLVVALLGFVSRFSFSVGSPLIWSLRP